MQAQLSCMSHGPYVVTVRCVSEPHDGRPARKLAQVRATSRHAVATLDEARELCIDAIADAFDPEREDELLAKGWNGPAYVRRIRNLPESGGMITLPDGTVIEVEPVSRRQLAGEAGFPYDYFHTTANLIAEYNSVHSAGSALSVASEHGQEGP